MDPQILTILALILGLAVGGAFGWFFGSRPVAELRQRFMARDGEARELDGKFRQAITDLAAASERASRADALAAQLDEARRDHAATVDTLRREQAGLSAQMAELKANATHFDEQKRLLLAAQEALKKEFEAAGAKVLEGAQEAFLKRAQERFEESEKTSAQRINTLLAPVDERLKSYVERVATMEAKNADGFGQLTGLIDAMRTGQEQVRTEAMRLGNSLRNAPKTRGRWGEQALRNVLEQCGLSEHTDFVTEHSIDTEEGRLRPDAIVRIPGNKLLVIDAKVSLVDYQDAFEATDEAVREACLDRHLASMRNHIQTLGGKSYQSQFEEAPDYVLMFVPGEHFISAAIEQDSKRHVNSLQQDAQVRATDLWNYAFERRVLLASPTNLVAIARTIAQVWRQDGLAKEAREIGRMGGELYDRIAKVADDLAKVGTHLGRAVGSYNDFTRSFESRVLVSAKRLRDKHIEIGKREIEEVPLVEAAPRHGDASGEVAALPQASNDEAAE